MISAESYAQASWDYYNWLKEFSEQQNEKESKQTKYFDPASPTIPAYVMMHAYQALFNSQHISRQNQND
jgi:hypothetical protein